MSHTSPRTAHTPNRCTASGSASRRTASFPASRMPVMLQPARVVHCRRPARQRHKRFLQRRSAIHQRQLVAQAVVDDLRVAPRFVLLDHPPQRVVGHRDRINRRGPRLRIPSIRMQAVVRHVAHRIVRSPARHLICLVIISRLELAVACLGDVPERCTSATTPSHSVRRGMSLKLKR
jgi:hypothetical protein